MLKKIKIILKDNKILFIFFLAWIVFGFSVYYFWLHINIITALKAALFFIDLDNDFSSSYNRWTEGIIFGIVLVFLFQNILEKHIPERYCRMVAQEMRNHIVIVGYSHLGERLVDFFKKKKIPYVVIEKDKEKVDELLRLNQPVIVDDAVEMDALKDAHIPQAKSVIITTDNVEASLLVTKRVREMNKNCYIVTRCYHDDLTEVIEYLGANEVISSSKNAFNDIIVKLEKA